MESARLAGNTVVGEQKRKGSHRSAVPCLRWRDSTRRALALVFIFIFQNSHPRPIVPLNTLCRMRRLAYNVAALRPPSELVIARWQRAQPFSLSLSLGVLATTPRPHECLPRQTQFPSDINSANGLRVKRRGTTRTARDVEKRGDLAAVENARLVALAYLCRSTPSFRCKSHHRRCWWR